MTINEMKEQRNRLITEASSLVKTEMNGETRAKIDQLYAAADAIKGDIARAEQAEALEAELRAVQHVPASGFAGAQGDSTATAEKRAAAYKGAYRKYMKYGATSLNAEEAKLMSEHRDLTAASGSNGAYIIPTDLVREIEVALKWYGGMRQVSKVIRTASGNPLNWPTNNDTANPGKRLNATTTPGTVDELDLTFGQVPFGAWTYTTQKIAVSNELLQDSAFDLDAFIKDAFVRRIGRIQNTEFTNGTGTTMPNGVVSQSTAGVTAATGGATSVTYNNLVDLIHSVDIAYRPGAVFMFHDTTLAAIRKLTDNYGRPLLGLGINGGDPDSILGYKYVVNNDMPVLAANAKSLLFGDFSKYVIRDVADLQIMRLDQLGALQNETIFVGFSRADGQLVDAGTQPIKQFVNSAT